jgi:uncharacterized protein YjbI with pentapeptide repeats
MNEGQNPFSRILDLSRISALPDSVWALIIVLGVLIVLALLSFIVVPTLWLTGVLVTQGHPTAEDLRSVTVATGAIIATPFFIWRIWSSHISATASLKQANVALETLANNTYSNAIAQLGSLREVKSKDAVFTEPNIEQRLGAIFSLVELGTTKSTFSSPVVELLAAYVRNHSKSSGVDVTTIHIPSNEDVLEKRLEAFASPNHDVVAAIQGIGRILQTEVHEMECNLTQISFRSIRLNTLTLKNTLLHDSEIDALHVERLNLLSCNIWNVSAVKLYAGHKSVLSKIRFAKSTMTAASFEFCSTMYSVFLNCTADRFSSAASTFSKSRFIGFNGSGITFFSTNFVGCSFEQCVWRAASFTDVVFLFADFQNVQFQILTEQVFLGVSAENGDSPFSNRTICCQMVNVDFGHSWLEACDLSGCLGLTQEQIDKAHFGDLETKLPIGLTRPDHWIKEKLVDEEHRRRRAEWEAKRLSRLDQLGLERMPFENVLIR